LRLGELADDLEPIGEFCGALLRSTQRPPSKFVHRNPGDPLVNGLVEAHRAWLDAALAA